MISIFDFLAFWQRLEFFLAPPPIGKKRVDIRLHVQKLGNGQGQQVHAREMRNIVSKLTEGVETVQQEKERQVFMTLMGVLSICGERNLRVKNRTLSPIGSFGKFDVIWSRAYCFSVLFISVN